MSVFIVSKNKGSKLSSYSVLGNTELMKCLKNLWDRMSPDFDPYAYSSQGGGWHFKNVHLRIQHKCSIIG